MTVKNYLMQIKVKTMMIRKQKEYIERLVYSLGIAGISYDKEKIQCSPDADRFAKVFGQIDEEEQKLKEMQEELVQIRVQIINEIHQMQEDKHKDLLNLVYVDCKSLKKASKEMSFSYDYVRELHGAALIAFAKMFPQKFC